MASAARGESSNPYGGGLGTGVKVRKPTARRSQKTPYDRSPTNSGLGGGEDRGGEDRGGGWLSKLVDSAQRLITDSGNRLFFFFFRKRETPLSLRVRQQQLRERVRMEDANASVNPTEDGFTDLEKILKEKTFTRSEIDRLTTLLRSKAADPSTVNGDQRNEVVPILKSQKFLT